MIGLDTTFLIEAEVAEHPGHPQARALLREWLTKSALALAPQVLTEFVHILTDPRRFERPLQMVEALERAEMWWLAGEVVHVFPTQESTLLMLSWMKEFGLGRKRLLDTALAATYFSAGVKRVATTNARDYKIFGCFEICS